MAIGSDWGFQGEGRFCEVGRADLWLLGTGSGLGRDAIGSSLITPHSMSASNPTSTWSSLVEGSELEVADEPLNNSGTGSGIGCLGSFAGSALMEAWERELGGAMVPLVASMAVSLRV
jgi:hypothetical protein